MKRVQFSKKFNKNYLVRLSRNTSLKKQFDERYQMFISGVRGYPLYDHALTKRMKGLRSFSVAGDIRVVYRETDAYYEFLDVGTHDQVYK